MIYGANRPCITNACADFSDSKWSGKSYVYVWLDENGIPFYVGSGRGNRASSVSRRNKAFQSKLNKYCSIWLVAENIHERFVFNVERYVVIQFINSGFSLCQKAYTNPHFKYGESIPDGFIEEKCGDIIQKIIGRKIG